MSTISRWQRLNVANSNFALSTPTNKLQYFVFEDFEWHVDMM
jgi:hypothetical protein